jgi:hypothetical protein
MADMFVLNSVNVRAHRISHIHADRVVLDAH